MLSRGERIEGAARAVVVNGVEHGGSKSGKNDCRAGEEESIRPRRQNSCAIS